MKEEGIHEGCIEQIQRLFKDRLYSGNIIPVDANGRIRIDDWEMREDIQAKVADLWIKVSTESLSELGDLEGYKSDFYNLFGFKVENVDYGKEVNEEVNIPSLI
jgi:enoyl-[acyl-carrier protein] reductase/trans-2-enoyl-CoA reductase (NAD+)